MELQLRRSSRLTVEGARLIASAMARTVSPAWRRSAISIRSASDRNRGEIAFVVKGSRGGTNRTVPSLRRTVWPRRQLWLVARLMPTSRRAAAGVRPEPTPVAGVSAQHAGEVHGIWVWSDCNDGLNK